MFNIKPKIKIFHMASMARSGETLMLKILGTHPNIVVVHNLAQIDNANEEKAFRFLMKYEKTSISSNHTLMKHYQLKRNEILLLKQGVWEHKFPFNGFVLARNPVAIYSSLKNYDRKTPQYNSDNNFWFNNEERLLRWLTDIDKSKIEMLKGKTPVEQFCIFYNIRMGNLLKTKLPVIRYEKLITDTESTIQDICNILDIELHPKMLESHKYYENGKIGHGQNDLSKPIDDSSLLKYKKNVTSSEFDFIKENTIDTYSQYGYKIENNEIIVE